MDENVIEKLFFDLSVLSGSLGVFCHIRAYLWCLRSFKSFSGHELLGILMLTKCLSKQTFLVTWCGGLL